MSFIDVPIIRDNKLSSFNFYNDLLVRIYNYYKDTYAESKVSIQLSMGVKEFSSAILSTNYIDPLALPLIACLGEQLKSFHKSPIKLLLDSSPSSQKLYRFLLEGDFFYIIGNNLNDNFPIGNELFDFDRSYIDNLTYKKEIRDEHKLRSYKKTKEIEEILYYKENEEDRRDYLVGYFLDLCEENFWELLEDNENTKKNKYFLLNVLAELISNGIHYSNSSVYAMMFVNRFSTKISIADNGIGFIGSLSSKQSTHFYEKNKITDILKNCEKNFNVGDEILATYYALIEALLFSCTKNREGLIDLIFSVINSKGIIRLHSEYTQVIFSYRLKKELKELCEIRKKVKQVYSKLLYNELDEDELNKDLWTLISKYYIHFEMLHKKLVEYYSENIRFSNIRFNEVRFNGVHIEVEIPQIQIEEL